MTAEVETFAHAAGTMAPWWNEALEGVDAKSWDEFQRAAGLDWEVEKVPLYRKFKDEDGSLYTIESLTGHAIVRASDNQELGVVGPTYTPIQNNTVFQWFDSWVEEGLAKFDTAGSLKGGKIVFALADVIGQDAEVRKGDKIRRHILLSNSHDGSTGILSGTVETRVVCMNTLRAAKAEGVLRSIRHTESAETKLQLAHDAMDDLLKGFAKNLEEYKQLAQSPIKRREDVIEYLLQVFEAPQPTKSNPNPEISARMKNTLDQVLRDIKGGVGNTGETWWDAYNGVTQYLTHEQGSNAEKRLVSGWFGEAAKKNKTALTTALDFARV